VPPVLIAGNSVSGLGRISPAVWALTVKVVAAAPPAKTVAVTPINVTLVNWLLTDDGRLAAVVSMLTLAGMPTLAIRGSRVENDSTHIPLSSYNVV
jgi:hypothetical protein